MGDTATEEVNGWPNEVLAPSAIPYNDQFPHPKELTADGIQRIKDAFVEGVKRAVQVGFDVVEIHNAHGYLLHEFLSPVSNKRTDKYGGSFENRIRLTLEIVEATRAAIPKDMPLFLRISASDWLDQTEEQKQEFPESWTIDDTVRLAPLLAERGVDLLDVSSAGLHPAQKIKTGPGYQAHFSHTIKKKVGDSMAVSTVGTITNGPQAQELLESGLDVAFVGRMFQKNPAIVWTFAEELGVEINVANQIKWGFGGRAGGKKNPNQPHKDGTTKGNQ